MFEQISLLLEIITQKKIIPKNNKIKRILKKREKE